MNIEVKSSDEHVVEVLDYDYDYDDDEVIIYATIRVTWEDYNFWIEYNLEKTVNKFDLDDECISFNIPGEITFSNCKYNIDNPEDTLKILEFSADSNALSDKYTSSYSDLFNKLPELRDCYIQLLDKANVDGKEYDKNDDDSILDLADDLLNCGYDVDEYDYRDWAKVDKIIADKMLGILHTFVKDNFEPVYTDGLDDLINDNIYIDVDIDSDDEDDDLD